MRVVGVRMRQDGVKDCFDGRRGAPPRSMCVLSSFSHLRIGQAAQPRQPAHMPEADRRKSGRLDRLEVPAAPLT